MDIFALQETWFDETVEDYEIVKNTNFRIERQDRSQTSHPKSGGGGVAFLVKAELTYRRLIFEEVKFLNYICILLQNPKLLVINVYFPQGFPEPSIKDFSTLLSNVQSLDRTDTIVIGDFNMPGVKWIEDEDLPGAYLPISNDRDIPFLHTLFDHDLKQIAPPPALRNHLDLVCVGDVEAFHMAQIHQEDLLDRVSVHHSPMGVNYHTPNSVRDRIKFQNFGRTNLTNSKIQLAQHRFIEISEDGALEEDFSGLPIASGSVLSNIRAIKDIQNRNTPVKSHPKNWLSRHPWLKGSHEYERALLKKKRDKARCNAEDTLENRTMYNRSSFELSKIYVDCREAFLRKVINESDGNTHEFYSLMKNGSKTRNDTPDTMIFENAYVEGDSKLSAMALHLGSNFLQNPPSFGEGAFSVNDSLFDIYQTNFDISHIGRWEGLNLKISIDTVSKLIKQLNSKKDPGPMKISADFLKFNSEALAPIITNALNTMILTGNIPDDWKECFLIPIPKKGSPINIENYRGIAIQSCLPKLLDQIITNILYEYLGDTISRNQHGFMRGRSTTTNLLEITQLIHENQKHSQIDVVYFDYSKAFDQIRYDILAVKLSQTGMPFMLYRLIMNFVINRKYIIKIDGVETNKSIVPKSSVPQGSHFGPILFILFINGIGVGELCYADDTKIFKIIRNMNDRNELQDRIDKLDSWSTENGLTLNPSKTFHVSYGKSVIASTYFLGGTVIETKKSVRDLGVIFDSKLNFEEHIKRTATRMNQMIGAARRMVTELKHPMLMQRIYSVYIRPIAEYCSIIWDQTRFNDPITLAHKKATRIALGVYYTMPPELYISYESRCEILNQDNPVTRRRTQAALTCIKILKGIMQPSFSEIISNHLDLRTNRRRNHLLLRTNSNIPARSPVAKMLAAATNYENVINLEQELSTIKGKIKEENSIRRTELVSSRQPTRSSTRAPIIYF